mmetsp:Transcript_2167/g.5506  ORF Transcript_2167/g.5506 Transcript_2167/m.5506 type:complete len:269 (+) Transcript_2167:366-1172(+)
MCIRRLRHNQLLAAGAQRGIHHVAVAQLVAVIGELHAAEEDYGRLLLLIAPLAEGTLALVQRVQRPLRELVALDVVKLREHFVHQAVVAHLHAAPNRPSLLVATGPRLVGVADVPGPVGGVEPHLHPQAPCADGVLEVKADAGLAGARHLGVKHARAEKPLPVGKERPCVDLVHKHEGDLPLRRKVVDALVLDGAARVRGGAKLGAADLVGAAVYQVPVVQTPTVRAQEAELRELAEQILRLGVPGNAAVRGGRRIVILRKNQEPGGR